MKSIRIAIALMFFCYGGQTFAQNGGYLLKGNISGATGKVYLKHQNEDGKVISDSTVAKNGAFQFKGKVTSPAFYELSTRVLKYPVQILMENSVITVTKSNDSLAMAKIAGSSAHDVYTGFYDGPWKVITTKAGDIYQRLDKVSQNGKVEPDPATRAGFDKEFRQLDTLNIKAATSYVMAHPTSAGSAAIIYDRFITYPNFKVANGLFALLKKDVQQSYVGMQISKAIAIDSKTAKGNEAPEIVMADKDGKLIRLSDFKGKYVLVDFWASWCGPCRKENPNVVAAYQKYHDKGFEILGVSLDSNKDAWQKAIKTDGLTWSHVSDLKGWANAAAAEYGVKAVPASFLIDKEGKVVGKDLRGEELHKVLASLFQ